DNVAAAVKKFGIQYPVVLDNDYSTWMAYQNQYWPHEYLIDIDGFIVHDHIGEGDYQNTEKAIQAALEERARVLGLGQSVVDSIANTPLTSETAPPVAGSPETYFGSARNQYLGNGAQGTLGLQTLTLPDSFDLNTLYLSGSWNFQDQYAENTSADAHIVYHYSSQDVYMVAASDTTVSMTVLRDGKPVGAAAGEDVSSNGTVSIHADRLYKLVHDPAGAGEHTLELIIHNPGLQAYTFTFG
ncbi:MAG: thiol-disulfide isomerase, partial [Patescibacteria group bacterium]|nr:thiol-disulfide isomerase [Patescibacteria group bacterium]